MEQQNAWLTAELALMRQAELRREIDHERLLAEHGLDLWSVLRRAIARRPRHKTAARAPYPQTHMAEGGQKARVTA